MAGLLAKHGHTSTSLWSTVGCCFPGHKRTGTRRRKQDKRYEEEMWRLSISEQMHHVIHIHMACWVGSYNTVGFHCCFWHTGVHVCSGRATKKSLGSRTITLAAQRKVGESQTSGGYIKAKETSHVGVFSALLCLTSFSWESSLSNRLNQIGCRI